MLAARDTCLTDFEWRVFMEETPVFAVPRKPAPKGSDRAVIILANRIVTIPKPIYEALMQDWQGSVAA